MRNLADLSYRQLHDWESKGVLPVSPDRRGGWRRFEPREIFALMICAEIRRRFGVPIERVRYVRNFMLKDGVDHLRAAVELMALLGVPIWLVTDLEETFILDSELEFCDLVENGFLGSEHPEGLIWIKVSPLVNRLLRCLKDPVHLTAHGRGYGVLRELREHFGARTAEEFEVLQLIRSGEYEKVEVSMKDGKVKTIRTDRRVTEPEQQDLMDLVREHDFQTLTLTTRSGRVVAISQGVPRKVDR